METYVHCSWDIVDPAEFKPRIPCERLDLEDIEIPRICVSDSIENALHAMPGTGETIRGMHLANIPVIVHVYYLTVDPEYVYEPSSAQVPDVDYTLEKWLLKEPAYVSREDYLITNEIIREINLNGGISEKLIHCDLEQVPLQDNYRNFVHSLSENRDANFEENAVKILENITSFRTLMINLDENFLYELKNAYKGE